MEPERVEKLVSCQHSYEGRLCTMASGSFVHPSELYVINSQFRIQSGFISRYPFTSAVTASVSFLVILVLILGASLLPIMLRDSAAQKRIELEPLESPVSPEEIVGSDSEESHAKRRKRARTSRSISQRMVSPVVCCDVSPGLKLCDYRVQKPKKLQQVPFRLQALR